MPAERLLALRGLCDWLEELRGLGGYRGLVVAHSSDVYGVAELLARVLPGPVTCVAPVEGRPRLRPVCGRLLSPSAIEELLGSESGSVVLAVPRLLRPNLFAAAAETVRAGGVVAVAAPPLGEWNPGGGMSIGAYRRYLLRRLGEARSIYWFDADSGTVYASRLPGGRAEAPEGPAGYRARSPVPRALLEAAATREQAEAMDTIIEFLRGRGRSVLVLGDRGRGKSGLLGLLLAYLVHSHMVGFVPVTAPSPWGVQSMFRVLSGALEGLRIKHWEIRRGQLVIGVAGPWFHIRYHTPDHVQPGPYLVVDEAAAVGPVRLRALAARSPRLLAATTVHGYEGSGRILSHMVERLLPAPRLVVELRTPVRYPPGDPLEEWVYETFMLRAEPGPPPSRAEEARPVALDRGKLVEDQELLRRVYALLVSAHYRNEPDDLALLLDAPHHRLYALLAPDGPVAVADVAEETPETPWEARILYDKLASATPSAAGLRGWRVVRIAVHPDLQRRGHGSRLLRAIEDQGRGSGVDWMGAIYGRPVVTRFWLSNEYLPVYVSPMPNRATGEHNIGVAKPLSPRGSRAVLEAASDTLARLLDAAHSLYRSIDTDTAALLATGSPLLAGALPPRRLQRGQEARARAVAAGQMEPEQALDAARILAWSMAAHYGGLWPLPWGERRAVAARVLQGRSLRELRHLYRLEELRSLLHAAIALMLSLY